jgi:hypothetical protein
MHLHRQVTQELAPRQQIYVAGGSVITALTPFSDLDKLAA